MTNVLDPQSLEQEYAADGRFFYEQADQSRTFLNPPEHPGQKERYLAESGFAYSYCFWLANRDSLSKDEGPIIESITDNTVTAVYFDSSGWREPVFKWRIARHDISTGDVQVTQLKSTPNHLQAGDEEAAHALETLLNIIEHEQTKSELQKRQHEADALKGVGIKDVHIKLEALVEARRKVGAYALAVVTREQHGSVWYAGPSNDYASPLDRLRRDLKKAGSFLEPSYAPPRPNPPVWDEPAKQAFLEKMAVLRASTRNK